jgi:hypothetical protein
MKNHIDKKKSNVQLKEGREANTGESSKFELIN